MGTPGSPPPVTEADIRGVFTQLDRPCTPVSADEAAEKLECPQQTARNIMTDLAERGELRSKTIDDANQVWWSPETCHRPTQHVHREEVVDALEDHAIFVLDPDGVVTSWNGGAERITGYEEDEIVGEHVSTFYTDTDGDEQLSERDLETAAEDGRLEDEGWRVREDGSRFWATVTLSAIRDDDGTLQGFTTVVRDVTERREVERRRRRERDLVERLFETVPVSIGVLDSDSRFVRANSRLLERHGIDDATRSEYGLSSLDIYDADGTPIPMDSWPIPRVAETRTPVYDFECQMDLSRGDRRWVSMTAVPLARDSRDETRVVVVIDDITERKEREQRLGRENNQTEKLLRTAPVAIAVQNADRETVMANQRAQDAFGLSEQEFLGNPVDTGEWDIYDPNGEPVDQTETTSARVLETGEPVFDEELVFELPNDEQRRFRVNTAPVFGPDGTIDRVITAGKDVTELKRREQQLEQRKAELETELSEIFDRISDAFYALDDDWRLTHVNEYAAEIMQRSKDELLGRAVWDVLPETAGDTYREHFQRAMETQESVTFEVYEDDRDVWLEFNAYPSETGLSIYFRDITERREYERQLAESERRYRTLAEHFPDGIVTLFDHDLEYELAAGQGFDRLSVEAADLEGASFRAVWDDDVVDVLEPVFQAALVGEEGSVEFEFEGREWLFHVVPITDDGGDVFAGLTLAQDITERKERERALRERERRLKRYKVYTDDILHAVDDVFYLLDETGELQRWNESVCDVTGYSNAEIESMTALEFFDEDEREKIADAIADGLETGNVQVEAEVLTRDRERIPYEFVASTLEDPDGNTVLAGLGRDITDRREYERKLEASNERLEQFAYAASHDLQEPLRMVTSYLQLLESRYGDDLDADAAEFIEFAIDGAERMREMIDGLLQYSRVETQGDPFEPIALDAVLSDVRDDLQLQIEESDATITAESLPRVHGDTSQLRQVFQNCVENAIEYSGDEPPRIHIAAAQTGQRCEISIRDEGIGIASEDQERIFEVFQRLHTHEEHDGTGIGLALCKRIVERHDGEIEVESDSGEGTTFSFTLPVADETREAAEE